MTIYEKYGGFDFFHDCIFGLYRDMFDHPEIAYHFIGVDMEKLSKLQTQFIIQGFGGPNIYEDGDLTIVHKRMGITPFEFNEIAVSFRGVFIKNGVSEADADIIMKFIAGQQPKIVTAQTSTIDKIMVPIYRFTRKYLRPFFLKIK